MAKLASRFARTFALAAYALALASAAAFAVWIWLLALGLLPARSWVDEPWPWIVNLAWLVLFGLQHSGMAREAFKKSWTRIWPPLLERSFYVMLASLLLVGITFTWQTLPGEPIWQGPAWLVGLSLAGAVGMLRCCNGVGHLDFLGLQQVWRNEATPDILYIAGPYRFLRHPLMASLLVFLWGQPAMTMTLFALNAGLSIYILMALRWEEADLARRFGQVYEDYRRHVPALIPWRRP